MYAVRSVLSDCEWKRNDWLLLHHRWPKQRLLHLLFKWFKCMTPCQVHPHVDVTLRRAFLRSFSSLACIGKHFQRSVKFLVLEAKRMVNAWPWGKSRHVRWKRQTYVFGRLVHAAIWSLCVQGHTASRPICSETALHWQVQFSDTTGRSCLRNPPIKAAVCVLSYVNLHAEVTSSAETLLSCYES